MKNSSPEYGSVVVINEATVVDPNESWVHAHVIGGEDYDKSSTKTEEEVTLQPKSSQMHSQATYRDLPFTILFVLHLGVISFLALACGSFPENIFDSIDGNSLAQAEQLLKVLGSIIVPCIIVSFFSTYFVTAVIALRHPMASVRISLYFSVITNASLMCVLCVSYPSVWTLLLAVAVLAYSIWYVSVIQPFIPFAAAILKLGLAGITANWGMYIVTMFLSALWCLWIAIWIYVANGIGFFSDISAIMQQNVQITYEQNGQTYYSYYGADVTKEITTVFLMLVSLYWISTILTNITQTTVAGVIGTWAFGRTNTDTSSCSNTPVMQSLHRSCTTSFGSICFGSLLNAVVIAIRVMLNWASDRSRESGENQAAALLYCVLKCIVLLFEDILEYFNQWAYIFVGLYGTTYLQSGKSVLELFTARGCSAIISDGLSTYFMNAVVMTVGFGCGALAVVGTSISASALNPWVAFWTCFVAATIISGIMMNAVQGAVKAVMVCYFDHPGKMFQNHPEETNALANGIALVFPSAIEFDFPTASSTTV
eukprot:CAMPEP_0194089998 /NCGR_PEP_ID=MMETSP0149-20130528/37005_1 /TAXON_ID=122233 /ORGANISM="Chaetoceros debilis, Strain MM31A-1" /LENGTH=539 /DNA_ID=CAMNT_0038774105 /DNA_START=3 /DNA_END=1622 /DNA_ORIENTATION=+